MLKIGAWYFPSAFKGKLTATGSQPTVVRCPLLSNNVVSSPSPLVAGKSDHWFRPGDGVVKPKTNAWASRW